MKRVDISKIDWVLTGVKPFQWALFDQMGKMEIIHPDGCTVKARIPASVQQLLRENNLLPDWNMGLNTRLCEWVENRHWLYRAMIPDSLIEQCRGVRLRLKGVDDNGEVWLNGRKVGEFANAHTEHVFDLSDCIQPTGNHLIVLFRSPELYLGQSYWTSKTKINKPRYYYGWDWCPRLVQIGFTEGVELELFDSQFIETLYTTTSFDCSVGSIALRADFHVAEPVGEAEVEVSECSGQVLYQSVIKAEDLLNGVTIGDLPVVGWYPNLEGEQPLYAFKLTYTTATEPPQSFERCLGFRHIEWLPCEGAKSEADPWLLSVNGKKVFMQGVNWTPIRVLYADISEQQYKDMLLKYKALGANILRVWGGATVEKECFYQLCDQLGLMVWQEFPLSSSGMCSTPSQDEQCVQTMGEVVKSYVDRRHYHPSLIAWSGGNELYIEDCSKPLGFSHPVLMRAKELVDQLDPHRRMMPTSPSGPTIFYDPTLNSEGVQWDVHGPWCLPFEPNDEQMSNIREFWGSSDALFHSEVGVAGSSSVEIINRYRGDCNAMPATFENPLWAQFSWWLDWDHYLQAHNGVEPESLEQFVEWHQSRQAMGLAIAVEEAKKRFPRCGGFVIWMGHDAFPAVSNTSIIDFEGELKPAAESVSRVWLTRY